jgi:hypothetical protein
MGIPVSNWSSERINWRNIHANHEMLKDDQVDENYTSLVFPVIIIILLSNFQPWQLLFSVPKSRVLFTKELKFWQQIYSGLKKINNLQLINN